MKDKSLVIALIISLLVFISVTFIFTTKTGYTYDEGIANQISTISSNTLDSLMKVISLFGSSEVILLLTVIIGVIFLVQRNWQQLLLFFVLSVGGVALNFGLKVAFQRERPGGESSMIEVFNYTLEIPSYSFPSGHTMRTTIFLLFIIYLIARYLMKSTVRTSLYVLTIALIIGVALSRLYLDAHFFSDTVAAISISVAWFSIVLLIFNKLTGNNETNYHRVIGM